LFWCIEKDIKDTILNKRYITKEEVIKTNPSNCDLVSWANGARLDSKFVLSSNYKSKIFIYIRSNNKDLFK